MVANIFAIFVVIILSSLIAHVVIETPARYGLRKKMGIKTVAVRL